MRRGTGALVALIGLAGVAIHLYAQSGPPSTPTQVTQTSYLKASNPDAADHFGCGGVLQGHTGQGVAISADGMTLAIGAPHEASASPGINGNQKDNSVFDAGAVYVFTRKGRALDSTGVRQSIQPTVERRVRSCRIVER
jgi:hypothetical protein